MDRKQLRRGLITETDKHFRPSWGQGGSGGGGTA